MNIKLLLLIVLNFKGISFVFSSDGICSKTIRQMRWKTVSYRRSIIDTYNDKCYGMFKCKKTRINYVTDIRYERNPVYETIEMCCDGYIRDSEAILGLKCLPVCMPACINGYCEGINRCTCNEGYQTSETYHATCTPVCTSGCPNGRCVKPDECECNFGYTNLNNTCAPMCSEECINATCTAPDTCQCLNGYRHSNESTNSCTPYCSTGCTDGYCREPETCACHEGYRLVENKCEPVCDLVCDHGKCVIEDEHPACNCDDGYKVVDVKCVPHCEHCSNGECIAPGECHCATGYLMMNNTCEAHCDPVCVNAACVAPNLCECIEGYTKIDGSCRPHCETPCAHNEYCAQPNTCACATGYTLEGDKCSPQCSSCNREACVAPDVCSCEAGYIVSNNTDDDVACLPVCEKICDNGTCIAPNECKCNVGFEDINGTCLENCDVGYERDFEFICSPTCTFCENGVCLTPDVCACLPGYTSDGVMCTMNELEDEEMAWTTMASKTSDDTSEMLSFETTVYTKHDTYLTEWTHQSKREKEKTGSGDNKRIIYIVVSLFVIVTLTAILIAVFKSKLKSIFARGNSYRIRDDGREFSVSFNNED